MSQSQILALDLIPTKPGSLCINGDVGYLFCHASGSCVGTNINRKNKRSGHKWKNIIQIVAKTSKKVDFFGRLFYY